LLNLFQGMRPLKRHKIKRDAIAGVTFAAMDIPQALGYTRIAGMPVVTGLYSLLLPLLAFATFGSSRLLVVAADSATAAILRSGLSGMAPAASSRYIALAGLVALLTSALLLFGRLCKLGFVADFLSQTVLAGFLTGIGFQVGIAVLGQMLGVPVASHKTVFQLAEVVRGLPKLHLPTLAVTLIVLAFVFALQRFAPKVPGPMLAVILATAASGIWNFAGHGIAIVGPVTAGLPHLTVPDVSWRDIPTVFSIAAACAVMILTQSAATSRIYAMRHHHHLDENQDLVGLSAANAAAAFSGTFVVNGSPTQTAMVEGAGSRSQVAQVTTVAVVALVLLFLTKPLQYLPQCVLGALVFLVAIRLIKLRSLADIRSESPAEFALAVATTVVVVVAGVETGIVLAMVMSLLRIVHHSYHPRTGVMIPDEGAIWKLVPPTPGTVTEPGLILYRFGAVLFYANASRFSDEIMVLVGPSPTSVRWLIVDAEAMANVDYSAARIVEDLHKNLAESGVKLGFARLAWSTKSDFDRHHLTETIGTQWIFTRLHDALDAYEKLNPSQPSVSDLLESPPMS
jgi:sulfate permease, SulP family